MIRMIVVVVVIVVIVVIDGLELDEPLLGCGYRWW